MAHSIPGTASTIKIHCEFVAPAGAAAGGPKYYHVWNLVGLEAGLEEKGLLSAALAVVLDVAATALGESCTLPGWSVPREVHYQLQCLIRGYAQDTRRRAARALQVLLETHFDSVCRTGDEDANPNQARFVCAVEPPIISAHPLTVTEELILPQDHVAKSVDGLSYLHTVNEQDVLLSNSELAQMAPGDVFVMAFHKSYECRSTKEWFDLAVDILAEVGGYLTQEQLSSLSFRMLQWQNGRWRIEAIRDSVRAFQDAPESEEAHVAIQDAGYRMAQEHHALRELTQFRARNGLTPVVHRRRADSICVTPGDAPQEEEEEAAAPAVPQEYVPPGRGFGLPADWVPYVEPVRPAGQGFGFGMAPPPTYAEAEAYPNRNPEEGDDDVEDVDIAGMSPEELLAAVRRPLGGGPE